MAAGGGLLRPSVGRYLSISVTGRLMIAHSTNCQRHLNEPVSQCFKYTPRREIKRFRFTAAHFTYRLYAPDGLDERAFNAANSGHGVIIDCADVVYMDEKLDDNGSCLHLLYTLLLK